MQKQIAIIRSDSNGLTKTTTTIAKEFTLNLNVDGKSTVIYCSPNYLEELAVGYLAGMGVITCKNDINSIVSDSHGVTVKLNSHPAQKEASDYAKIGDVDFELDQADVAQKLAKFNLGLAEVKAIMERFINFSITYKSTRGVHSCAVGCGKKQLFFADDVARHNAYSKALGYCILNELDMSDKYIMLSGRMSGDMVRQANRVGVKLLISKASPLEQAINLARAFDIGIIGLVEGTSCNIYNL